MNILSIQNFRRFSGFGSPQIVIYNSKQKAIVNKSGLILLHRLKTKMVNVLEKTMYETV